MIVNSQETIKIDKEHSIEFGSAPWDSNVDVIRRRKNNSSGGYDPYSSSTIPINEGFLDIGILVVECLKKDRIPQNDMVNLMIELKNSAQRMGVTL